MLVEVQYSHNVKNQIPSSTFIEILHFALRVFHEQKRGESMVTYQLDRLRSEKCQLGSHEIRRPSYIAIPHCSLPLSLGASSPDGLGQLAGDRNTGIPSHVMADF